MEIELTDKEKQVLEYALKMLYAVTDSTKSNGGTIYNRNLEPIDTYDIGEVARKLGIDI